MMAPLKLIAALVIALSTIVLTVEAGKGFESIAEEIAESIKASKEDQADAEKVYSVAKNYVRQLNSLDKPNGEQLLRAWNKVLHEPNWFTRKCDKSTLSHIKTISLANPKSRPELRTLEEATEKYARECVKKDYIEERIESKEHEYKAFRREENILTFIDDRFFADYWSEHSEDKSKGMPMERSKATTALAKAIIRTLGNNMEEIRKALPHVKVKVIHDFLWGRLYEPCLEYWNHLSELYFQTLRASEYLEGGYQKLFSSLNNKSQDSLSRLQVCMDDKMAFLGEHAWLPSKDEAYETSELVFSEIKSLASN